jgi:hypothetical protein
LCARNRLAKIFLVPNEYLRTLISGFQHFKLNLMIKLFLSIILFFSFQNDFTGQINTGTNATQQKVYQYMSVCTDGHGVLSPWMDTQDEANKFGKDHEVLTKGHRWRIDTREKPKKDSINIK